MQLTVTAGTLDIERVDNADEEGLRLVVSETDVHQADVKALTELRTTFCGLQRFGEACDCLLHSFRAFRIDDSQRVLDDLQVF